MQALSMQVQEADSEIRERPLTVLLYSAVSPGQAGGVQTAMRRLERALSAEGHRVHMAWADGGPIALPLRLRDPSRGPGAILVNLFAVWRRLRRLRPDIVNVHFLTGQALYFVLLAPVLGYRLVLSVHGSDLLRPARGVRRLLPLLVRGAHAVTVVSQDLSAAAKALPGLNPARVHCIANGVDLRFWQAEPRREAASPVLFAAGRLEHVKGFDLLIRAFAEVRRQYPKAMLKIAGVGSCQDSLRVLAARLGVAHAVVFLGRLDPAKLRTRLAEAHAFVMPSRSEGLPLALLEAMAAGAPIVASAVGGVPEAAEGAALLLAPDDGPALRAALEQVLGDEALREQLSAAARLRAAHYDAVKTGEAFERLYRALVQRGGATP